MGRNRRTLWRGAVSGGNGHASFRAAQERALMKLAMWPGKTVAALAIAIVIIESANCDRFGRDGTLQCWKGEVALARSTGLSPRAVRAGRALLRDHGIIISRA